eukprot:CAMPEP_0179139176 /NCGR_PEP_ID=MMETSP0796-20121207/66536_1 /TAXON_ID=73915 /ORGANISM="Pyrodinium bahamense, Strain pbaha01" /LENGTH=46 /DNA_ID= /DNA_START= /DNA_END= /DNA_ORIENTATION=
MASGSDEAHTLTAAGPVRAGSVLRAGCVQEVAPASAPSGRRAAKVL